MTASPIVGVQTRLSLQTRRQVRRSDHPRREGDSIGQTRTFQDFQTLSLTGTVAGKQSSSKLLDTVAVGLRCSSGHYPSVRLSANFECQHGNMLLSFRIVHRCSMILLTVHMRNNAPLVAGASCALQSLCSFRIKTSPSFPKQKLAAPPSTRILPSSTPPGDHTLMPSPHPLYTFPYTSHLIPSGMPVSAIAKSRRCVRNGWPE